MTKEAATKNNLMQYGMYAGLGLVTGVLLYFGWVKVAGSKVAPLASSATGANKNDTGTVGTVSPSRASWHCQKYPQAPECNPKQGLGFAEVTVIEDFGSKMPSKKQKNPTKLVSSSYWG